MRKRFAALSVGLGVLLGFPTIASSDDQVTDEIKRLARFQVLANKGDPQGACRELTQGRHVQLCLGNFRGTVAEFDRRRANLQWPDGGQGLRIYDAEYRRFSAQLARESPPPRTQVAAGGGVLVDTYFKGDVFYARNRGNVRVTCQMSGLVYGSGVGTMEPQLHHRSLVLFPGQEDTIFTGRAGNPRLFDCRAM